jgi:hypothetical protein
MEVRVGRQNVGKRVRRNVEVSMIRQYGVVRVRRRNVGLRVRREIAGV